MPNPVRKPCNYLGLDMSLNATGYCVIQLGSKAGEHLLTNHRITTMGVIKMTKTGPARLLDIRSQLHFILSTIWKPELVAIEGYAHGASFQAHQLGEVGGMARLLLWENGIPFVEVQPTQLKQFATGAGKGAKKTVRDALNKKWRMSIKDHNEADAWGLAMLSALAMGGEMGAGECSLVSSLRYCSPDGAPSPLLTRPI